MRRKTNHVCIYYNDQTKKYDVKYNYKEYDAKTNRNVYKSKWKYNLRTMEEAKKALSSLKTEKRCRSSNDITLADLLPIYERGAKARGLTSGTIDSTRKYMSTISRFIPASTKLASISVDTYSNMLISMREAGLKSSTIKIYSGCLKKMFRIAYMHGHLNENIFDRIDDRHYPLTRGRADELSRRLITSQEFERLKTLLQNHSRSDTGKLTSETYQLLFSLLYYGGLRIGEALALEPKDFRKVLLGAPIISGKDPSSGKVSALQVEVTKTLVMTNGKAHIEAGTKNHKDRYVPLPATFSKAYMNYLDLMTASGKQIGETDRIFPVSYGAVYEMLIRCCESAGIPRHTPHDFRHTYISNLITAGLPISDTAYFSGDTEAVILNTYVHATENYKVRLLEALSKFPK